ncbi:hypothetical protein VT84_36025 [Gemmata sp. SH-PL17]|uniref:pilus assembly FimT family protein n=1 Tax=Gemmata sp. SH-PL17 TaxID=1630693 RepID=UPI0004B19ABF|nr:prepilin-type N-terminal cleavage/methylation domain-containing protein [Gemmata sp. SH-PL17]AMV29858.1 hypothetical protein VT84_36025 [Gemmata sp. SH-PL17]
MTRTNTRGGFTLIELLVAMAIITTLAGFILLVYPGARDQDRARNAVSDLEATFKMAQGMAARDKSPRGVRFIVDGTGKPDARFVTELQYVELPPPLIPNLKPLTSGSPDNEPRVRFDYTPLATGTTPPAGTVNSRKCFIENLTLDQATQILPNSTIVMPVFGSWHKVIGVLATTGPNASGRYTVQVALEVFPDAIMGGGTQAVTYHFSVYLPATPLVGEPTVLLSKNICVDLNVPDLNASPRIMLGSIGPPPNTGDFDVIFSPDGKLVGAPSGQLFFWVRDYTKVPNMRIGEGPALVDAFRRVGDMYIVSVRASGALGHNQVLWPNMGTGVYPAGQDPFLLARQEQNQ